MFPDFISIMLTSNVSSLFAPKEQKESEKEEAAEEHRPEEPQDIVLKVDMDCQGCAKKVEKSLLRFEGLQYFIPVLAIQYLFRETCNIQRQRYLQTGVENVTANSRSKTVVVKSRTADPAKVCERVQRKTKRRVELISPLHPPPAKEEKKEQTPPPPTKEEKKEEVTLL